MQTQVHEIDPVTVELSVEVPWERVKAGLDQSYRVLQRTAQVKGFRKGKVPRNIVQKIYGSRVKNEVTAQLVEEGIFAGVKEHELPVVAPPEMGELPAIQKGEPLSFKAKLEIRPNLDEIVTDGLAVERPVATIDQEELTKSLRMVQENQAEIVTPEPMRPAKEGDLLTIVYTAGVTGEEDEEEMKPEERVVELGSGRLVEEIEAGLQGTSPGDEKDIIFTYPEDSPNPELRGKEVTFSVKVQELREKVLPELNDELAKDHGEFDTLDELKASLRADLQKAAEGRSEAAVRSQLVEKLVDLNPVPVPPSMTNNEITTMQRQMAYFAQITGQPMESEITEEMRAQAERKVRAAILFGALARRESLEVTDEDIEAKMAEIAEETGKHIAKVRVEHQGEDKRQSLEAELLEKKLLEYLAGIAKVTDAPAEQKAEDKD